MAKRLLPRLYPYKGYLTFPFQNKDTFFIYLKYPSSFLFKNHHQPLPPHFTQLPIIGGWQWFVRPCNHNGWERKKVWEGYGWPIQRSVLVMYKYWKMSLWLKQIMDEVLIKFKSMVSLHWKWLWEEPLQSIFSIEILIQQAQTSGFVFIVCKFYFGFTAWILQWGDKKIERKWYSGRSVQWWAPAEAHQKFREAKNTVDGSCGA